MNKLNLSVKFEQVKEFEHPDFTKVNIWVATYGENANGSNITKQAFENAMNSLYNIPILGEWSESIEDFKGHGGKLEISDDGIKFIETTKAYGVIPENCNPRWEFDKSGIEYLVCDGILWTSRYPEAEKVMENLNNQSMEISVLDYEEDENQVMVINNFNFTGICILGENTAPCFPSAKVVYSLNKEDYKKEFSMLLEEVKNINFGKGGNKLDEKKELIKKYSYLKSEKYETIINDESLSFDDLKEKLFTLSVEDLDKKIREKLKEITHTHTDWWGDTYECQKYYLIDILPTENIAICEDSECWYRYYGIPYTLEGDGIILNLDEFKRYIRGDWREYIEGESEVVSNVFEVEIKHNKEKVEEYNSKYSKQDDELRDMKGKYIDLNSTYVSLQEENKELAEFKLKIEKEQKDAELNSIFVEYSALNKVVGYNELFEKRYELEKEELIKSLKVLAFDNNIDINSKNKRDFSKNIVRVPVVNMEKESNTDTAWCILDKYIKNN